MIFKNNSVKFYSNFKYSDIFKSSSSWLLKKSKIISLQFHPILVGVLAVFVTNIWLEKQRGIPRLKQL